MSLMSYCFGLWNLAADVETKPWNFFPNIMKKSTIGDRQFIIIHTPGSEFLQEFHQWKITWGKLIHKQRNFESLI